MPAYQAVTLDASWGIVDHTSRRNKRQGILGARLGQAWPQTHQFEGGMIQSLAVSFGLFKTLWDWSPQGKQEWSKFMPRVT